MNIKNRNYFWYEGKTAEQQRIANAINTKLNQGVNVLYSGNLLIWAPDVIYLPPKIVRLEHVSSREGFYPIQYQFDREQYAYEEVSKKVDTVRSIEELLNYIESEIA